MTIPESRVENPIADIERRHQYRGVLYLFSETGTEGGYWALQDERFIAPPNEKYPYEQWSYEGLHILKDGDELIIFSPEKPEEVVWQGQISLRLLPLFTEQASGLWIHADQEGIDRNTWASYFFNHHPAKLKTEKSGQD